jgi:hypothetical protein
MFDIADHLDELRCWPTDRLEARRREVVSQRRRLETEELAIVRVLDERGRIDPNLDGGGESAGTVRDKVETARRLESLPEIAAAAYEGALSSEQLSSVTKFADEASDAEWARRAPNVAPAELARMARNASKPSTDDSRARREARGVRMWWTPEKGMFHLHCQWPDLMGAKVEAAMLKWTEQMKPAKGQAWDSFEHRAADALFSLCGCGQRHTLQVHHLRPKSWGGTDDPSNLAALAAGHHPMYIPHGPLALVGNPNQPDGLRTVHLDDLTPQQAEQVGLPRPPPSPTHRE